jgi:hypothetical protein
MTAQPGGHPQPAQDQPGRRLWVSSTGRWWALRQTVLTPAQMTAGCRPLIYAPDNPALTALIGARNELTKRLQPGQPTRAPPDPAGRGSDAGTVWLGNRDVAGLLLRGEMYGGPTTCRRRAGGPGGPVAGHCGGRVRPDGPAEPRAGVVLADPPRPGRDRPVLHRAPPCAGEAGAYPRGLGGPAVLEGAAKHSSRAETGGGPNGGWRAGGCRGRSLRCSL